VSACKRPSGTVVVPAERVPLQPARTGYVTNNGSDSIAAIDLDGARVETRSLDVDPELHEAPHHLAIDSRAGTVFVALSFPAPPSRQTGPHKDHGTATLAGRIARLDLATLGVNASRDVDPSPGDLVLTRDHTRLLVTHFDMKRAMEAAMAGAPTSDMFATLQVWDARSFERIASRPLCVAPHGIATTADGKTAIVACYGSDEIAIVDLTSPSLASARYPLGSSPGVPGAPRYGPYAVTLSPDESRVAVANLEGASVRIFDLATRRFVRELDVTVGARAFMPAFVAGHDLLVPLQAPDGLARIDVDKGVVVARVAFERSECQSPHAVRVARDGRVYLVCEGDHAQPGAVIEVDPATLALKRRWMVGVYPDGLAFGDE
jgi:DNA-binding beta-propeller fold protein YncE